MENEKYTFELIEQYLAGELEGEALRDFEAQLKSNPDLAKAVGEQRLTHKAVDIYAQIKTKEQVKSLHEQVRQGRRRQRTLMIPLAASIALLIAVGLWLFSGNNTPTTDELVAANFDLYPNRITTMGETDSLLAIAMEAYEEKEFETALRVFSEMPNDLPEAALIHLYGGVSYLGLHEPDNALLVLGRIGEDSPYREAARWYEALAYLEKQQTEEARTVLEQIVQEGAFPGEKARILLGELKGL